MCILDNAVYDLFAKYNPEVKLNERKMFECI